MLKAVDIKLKEKNLDLSCFALSIRLQNKFEELKLTEVVVEAFLEKITIPCFQNEMDKKEFLIRISSGCYTDNYSGIPVSKPIPHL